MVERSWRRRLRGPVGKPSRRCVGWALTATLLAQFGLAFMPAMPTSIPLLPTRALAGETLASPEFVGGAVMPNGQVGLIFRNEPTGSAEIRFLGYTSEHSLDASQQLSTAGPSYPSLVTFRGILVAGYVDTRALNAGKFIVRTSTDSGASWAGEWYPFGSATFDSAGFAPRLVTSRDQQTLYLFSAVPGAKPQYRSTTDPALVTWSSPVDAGDASMRAATNNNCGSSGAECGRAHHFEFMETATAGRWIYISKSDAGFGQSGRGTQAGTLGGAWSTQIDLGGSGGISGCCGESTATSAGSSCLQRSIANGQRG